MSGGKRKANETRPMKNTRDEQKEREEKRFNLVLHGVTESKHMDATSKWNEEELKKVKELAKIVGVELGGGVTVKWRCGRRSVESVRKPRPLIVKLTHDQSMVCDKLTTSVRSRLA